MNLKLVGGGFMKTHGGLLWQSVRSDSLPKNSAKGDSLFHSFTHSFIPSTKISLFSSLASESWLTPAGGSIAALVSWFMALNTIQELATPQVITSSIDLSHKLQSCTPKASSYISTWKSQRHQCIAWFPTPHPHPPSPA